MGSVVRQVLGMATHLSIAAILLLTLPMALLGFAASGSTLSSPADEWRVGGLFLAYSLADLVTLFLLILMPSRKLPLLFGGVLAALPIAAFVLMPYLQAPR